MTDIFSGCEFVELAIQIEENGKDFYAELAKTIDSPEAKAAFGYLACEEANHINTFRKIFNSTCEYKPDGAYPDEYFEYMNSLASTHVFTQKGKGKELAASVKSFKEGIDLGIKFENDSILFFESMKKVVSPDSVELVDKLISEEKKHLEKLLGLKGE